MLQGTLAALESQLELQAAVDERRDASRTLQLQHLTRQAGDDVAAAAVGAGRRRARGARAEGYATSWRRANFASGRARAGAERAATERRRRRRRGRRSGAGGGRQRAALVSGVGGGGASSNGRAGGGRGGGSGGGAAAQKAAAKAERAAAERDAA